MKAISVKQPWANLIASGQKTIETRSQKTAHRGDLLIVSSKSPPIEPAGFALCIVQVINCRRMIPSDEARAKCKYFPNLYSWVFTNIRPIKQFRVAGQRGFYDVSIRTLLRED